MSFEISNVSQIEKECKVNFEISFSIEKFCKD